MSVSIDPKNPLAAVTAASQRVSNQGRWGQDDIWGTLNFIDDSKRRDASKLVHHGKVFSLSQPYDQNGPQRGWRRRNNPIHTMLSTGLDAEFGPTEFPHGIGGADDYITMPLQSSTQWDGLGHIFDRGMAYNGRRASAVVTSDGDLITGIQTAADRLVSRGVLLDVGRVVGGGELPDGYAITAKDLDDTIAAQGTSASIGRGDIMLIRTGQYSRVRREGWGDYAGGNAPGLSFTTLDWIHGAEIAAVATDTWGVEVRPNEFDVSFQPFHQVAIPHMGLYLGEMWDLDDLAADCARDGVYEFLLVSPPLAITGAVGSPLNPIAMK